MVYTFLVLIFLKVFQAQNIRYQGRAPQPHARTSETWIDCHGSFGKQQIYIYTYNKAEVNFDSRSQRLPMAPPMQQQRHSSTDFNEDPVSSLDDLEAKLTRTGKWSEFMKKIQESGERANGKVMENWEQDANKWADWAYNLEKPSAPINPKTERSILHIAESEERPSLGMESYWGSGDKKPHEGFEGFRRHRRVLGEDDRFASADRGGNAVANGKGTPNEEKAFQKAALKMKYLEYLQKNNLPFSPPSNQQSNGNQQHLPPGITEDMIQEAMKAKAELQKLMDRPSPDYQNGQPPNYQNGPPPNYQNGPPLNYQNSQPLNYQNGPTPSYQNGPPPKYQNGQQLNYQNGPPPKFQNHLPPNYKNGPPLNYQNGPPNYKNGPPLNYQKRPLPMYQNGPRQYYQNGPLSSYQNGPPPIYKNGLSQNYEMDSPPKDLNGPPPSFQNGPPPNFQNSPSQNYQNRPPPMYQDGPPPNYQNSPHSYYQNKPRKIYKNGLPHNYEIDPPANYQNSTIVNYKNDPIQNHQNGPPPNSNNGPPQNIQNNLPPNLRYEPPKTTVNPLESSNLPEVDDFQSPIRWVKFNSKQITDGLAKVTDVDTGVNKQYTINGTIYVPIIDNNIERIIGSTTTQVPLLSTYRTALRMGPKSSGPPDSRDWLTRESENAKNVEHEPACDGDGCQARCHQLGCQSSCGGDTCSAGCKGANCNSYCKGPGCLSMCIGDRCTSRCDGLSCDSRCQGVDCEATCQAFSCFHSVNGALSRGAGDWKQWYPQYNEYGEQKNEDPRNNKYAGGDYEGEDHGPSVNYEGPEGYNL